MEIEKLKSFLENRTGLAYYDTKRKNLVSRCPWCDNNSSKTHGHLYIDLNVPIFNCFKKYTSQGCPSEGVLPILLKKLGENPNDYLSQDELILNYKKSQNLTITHEITNFNIPELNQDLYHRKVDYLNNRLGHEYNIEDIPRLILNIGKFIYINKINLPTVQRNRLPYLEENFIGFLGNRGKQITLRNIDENSGLRFNKIELTEEESLVDFYGIETSSIHSGINTIVLCEGVFDLLCSIKHN